MDELSTTRAVTLYVGALLGPGVLLLPGLAAEVAGPASIVAWAGLLVLSGLLAAVFGALGRSHGGHSGAAGFAGAAFGPRAERAVAVCFLGGAVLGAPVVCLIGASYAARPFGGGPGATTALAAVLLVLVVALTASGGRSSAGAQLGLVGVLVALVTVAVVAAAPHARAEHWTPFAPHGWTAVGTAGSVLMLSFVGWEAVSPMTARLRAPRRQLPRVIAAAFVVTSTLYLGLAAATVGVLGPGASSPTPVADLLRVGVGPAGTLVAALVAACLTLAATNAYLTGAAAMTTAVSGPRAARRLPLGVGVVGVVLLLGTGLGWWSTATLVAIPTVLFLAVYVAATAAGARLLAGPLRAVSAVACAAVTVVLAFAGVVAVLPLLVVAAATAHRGARVPAGART
ncbi:APC family permease [Actinomycetospora sp. CA-084318]|uniref:APC family permease n=1 Tax=Actinomycetospora sp. CA-084318 TaxID=3239892 RepID=UPI003D96367C